MVHSTHLEGEVEMEAEEEEEAAEVEAAELAAALMSRPFLLAAVSVQDGRKSAIWMISFGACCSNQGMLDCRRDCPGEPASERGKGRDVGLTPCQLVESSLLQHASGLHGGLCGMGGGERVSATTRRPFALRLSPLRLLPGSPLGRRVVGDSRAGLNLSTTDRLWDCLNWEFAETANVGANSHSQQHNTPTQLTTAHRW